MICLQNENILMRDQFIMALEGKQPPGLVPTFEILFALTMELLRKVHPRNRALDQWDQMSRSEQALQIADAGEVYIKTARHFCHSAIVVFGLPGVPESERMIAEFIREETGYEFFLIKPGGDSTLAIPDGKDMMTFCHQLVWEPNEVKREQTDALSRKVKEVEPLAGTGLFDGIILGSDYCFNAGPFMSPTMFADLITPFLARLVLEYRGMGFTAKNQLPLNQ
jgi:uroporphyrinogen decarboxylase